MKKILGITTALALILSLSVSVFAAGFPAETGGTNIDVTVQGTDNTLTRSTGYGDPEGSTDIIDDNHAFNKAVEVWCETRTWLRSYSSGTANGIPDWTLIAMCQLYVSNGDERYIKSPTQYAYDKTSCTATTKKVNAKDGGSASATGYHTVKDYNGTIIWTDESSATENF